MKGSEKFDEAVLTVAYPGRMLRITGACIFRGAFTRIATPDALHMEGDRNILGCRHVGVPA